MGAVAKDLVRELHDKTREARRNGARPATSNERTVYARTRARAARSQGRIAFNLTPTEFDLLVTRADGRCEETGVAFGDRRVPNGPYRYPDRMSIDRLSNSSGYALENVRLVRTIVNFARGSASLIDFHKMMYLSLHRSGARVEGGDLLERGLHPEDWRF